MANSPICKAFVYDLSLHSCALLDFDLTYQGSAHVILNGPGYVSVGNTKIVFIASFLLCSRTLNSSKIPKLHIQKKLKIILNT